MRAAPALVYAALAASAAHASMPGPGFTIPSAKTANAAPAIPGGVRVAGIPVGGLAPGAAAATVRAAFATSLQVVVQGARFELRPPRLATAYIDPAISRARAAPPGTNIPLVISVHGAAVRSVVTELARRFDRKPRNAALSMSHGRPFIAPGRHGVTLDTKLLLGRLVRSLLTDVRRPLSAPARVVRAAVTPQSFGPMILINRAANRLTLFRPNNRVWRVFPVATGQAIYPTPAGRFSIVVKWVNPWWYPPTYDAWAAGLKPVPPGPGNPLGTRWMGLSTPGVGIHGTDAPGSIGYNASHGCIRMQVADSEWLFTRVKVGTAVFIV